VNVLRHFLANVTGRAQKRQNKTLLTIKTKLFKMAKLGNNVVEKRREKKRGK